MMNFFCPLCQLYCESQLTLLLLPPALKLVCCVLQQSQTLIKGDSLQEWKEKQVGGNGLTDCCLTARSTIKSRSGVGGA
jgi:hypothetical protein